MRDLRCRLFGHKPYVEDKPGTVRAGRGTIFFGGIRRYCGRCGITLNGDIPRVGDRRSHAA